MVTAPRKREGQQLLLRFPERSDLRDRLEAVANANNRTVTKEIIHRLEQSLEAGQESARPTMVPAPDIATRVASLEAAVMSLLASEEMRDGKIASLERVLKG